MDQKARVLMRILWLVPLVAVSTAPVWPAWADQMEILNTQQASFSNPNCQASGTCDLKSFSTVVQNYGVEVDGYPGWNYGTRMYAGFTTSGLSTLYNYGIVQFIHGCQYGSYLQNGVVQNLLNVDTYFYGKDVTFQHPTWVIDGLIDDPLDWGDQPNLASRFTYYDWSPSGAGIEASDAVYVGAQSPTHSTLFVVDRPGVVAYEPDSGMANNISLEFKTCVFRTKDVPRSVPADDVSFAQPLQCFSWNSSWVYNFKTSAFENPTAISPICLDPNAPRPSSSQDPAPGPRPSPKAG